MAQEAEMAYLLAQAIAEYGTSVTLRHVTEQQGPNPYPNPFVGALTVNGAQLTGASTLNIAGANVNGRLAVGDRLSVAGDSRVYTLTGAVNSVSNGFAAPISPTLGQNESAGAAVTVAFAADAAVAALVTSFPSRLVNNTSIQLTDRQVRFLAAAISFTPVTTDKVLIGSDQYSIVAARAVEMTGTIYAWSLQVRR